MKRNEKQYNWESGIVVKRREHEGEGRLSFMICGKLLVPNYLITNSDDCWMLGLHPRNGNTCEWNHTTYDWRDVVERLT